MKLKVAVHPDTCHWIGPITVQNTQTPSYEDCKDEIRDLARKRWEAAGKPEGKDLDFWLLAEYILFGKSVEDGYRIYVMDRTRPNGFYYHRDAVLVTPHGPRQVSKETWR